MNFPVRIRLRSQMSGDVSDNIQLNHSNVYRPMNTDRFGVAGAIKIIGPPTVASIEANLMLLSTRWIGLDLRSHLNFNDSFQVVCFRHSILVHINLFFAQWLRYS